MAKDDVIATSATAAAKAGTTVNCCNGRVGRNLLAMAETSEVIRQVIAPTGVELINAAARAGVAGETVNCCNGRVGSALNVQQLLTDLGGGGQND
jgi:hypothetical protein